MIANLIGFALFSAIAYALYPVGFFNTPFSQMAAVEFARIIGTVVFAGLAVKSLLDSFTSN